MFSLPIRILRGVQAVLAIIVLGTGAYCLSVWSGDYYDCVGLYCSTVSVQTSQLGYIVFDSVFTVVALLYLGLAPIFLPKIAHPIAMAVLDGFLALIWFSGAIALAVWTGAYTNLIGAYQVLQACVAFAFFTWASFVATTVLSVLTITKGGSTSRRSKEEDNANPELQHATV